MKPTEPLVSDVRLDQLNDREWPYAWHHDKLRWSIAKQVRDLRVSRGWTQTDLANKAETYASVISGIENQKRSAPTLNTLIRIARAFDCALICRFVGWSEWLKLMEELEKSCPLTPSFDVEMAAEATS